MDHRYYDGDAKDFIHVCEMCRYMWNLSGYTKDWIADG